jgi:hypothetical protein
MAKNDITGAEIKTSSYSKQGRENHDSIFAKRPALEWAEKENVKILDPDGFRNDDGVTLLTPISYSEFKKRLNYCTICLIMNPEAIQKVTIE